jgi:hypothetical protein
MQQMQESEDHNSIDAASIDIMDIESEKEKDS